MDALGAHPLKEIAITPSSPSPREILPDGMRSE